MSTAELAQFELLTAIFERVEEHVISGASRAAVYDS